MLRTRRSSLYWHPLLPSLSCMFTLILILGVRSSLSSAETCTASNAKDGLGERPPTDYFLLGVAILIGLAIGLALPFFLELARRDIPATKSTSSEPKYSKTIVERVVGLDEIVVNCLGNRYFEIQISKTSTCLDVVKEVKTMLDLSNGKHEYGLFVRHKGTSDFRLDDGILVHTAMIHWEHRKQIAQNDLDSTDRNEGGNSFEFVFNVFTYAPIENEPTSLSEQDFVFEKAFDSVMRRQIPLESNELVKLAAVRAQCLFGDIRATSGLPDTPKVHPAFVDGIILSNTIVAANEKNSKAKTKRGQRGSRTGYMCSAGRKMNKDEQEKLQEKIEAEWSTLDGTSIDAARRIYMGVITQWSKYRYTVIDVKQLTHPEWPKDVWLLIGDNGVAVHEKFSRRELAIYAYHSIHSFGAPLAKRYKITVSGKGDVEFETQHVHEIARAMRIYIQSLTNKITA